MRGEHNGDIKANCAAVGSSPHARGALSVGMPHIWRVGIIPACAGSTRPRRYPEGASWDHPRMRGEHTAGTSDIYAVKGSSPHARGALCSYVATAPTVGIIPACAGSTVGLHRAVKRRRDHPRMRGEHVELPERLLPQAGSSPHARGALRPFPATMSELGIIPACAGSTHQDCESRAGKKDHPRMRGEHSMQLLRLTRPTGSSPHARGARRRRVKWQCLHGIIPACAGSTR